MQDTLIIYSFSLMILVGNLYNQMWYPCGSFKGDDRSAALCSSWRDGGLLAGVSKSQLDKGVSGSLFRDQEKLVETICRGYPQLRKAKEDLGMLFFCSKIF